MATVPERELRSGATLVVLAVLLLTGCKSVSSGVVVSRDHQLPYTYITMQCGSYGSDGSCKFYIPLTNYVPERWELCLRDDSEDKPVKDQSQGCVDVSDGQTWDRYPAGSHYP